MFNTYPQRVTTSYDTIEGSELAAEEVIKTLTKHCDAIIILPTGSTPIMMYEILVQRYRDEELDFSRAHFFNLDEYFGLPADHPLSYNYYMKHLFYDRLAFIDPQRLPNCHIPYPLPGEAAKETASRYAKELQEALDKTGRGGADLTILGLGKVSYHNSTFYGGHIGFNEPGSDIEAPTRAVSLTEQTINATAYRFRYLKLRPDYKGKSFGCQVPHKAITIGIKEIMQSHRIVMLVLGETKSQAVHAVLESSPNSMMPATFLHTHPSVHWIIDQAAAKELSPAPEAASIIPVEDHLDNNDKIVVIAPHPDDDIIGLGGLLQKLPKQRVWIIYLTSGENSLPHDNYEYLQALAFSQAPGLKEKIAAAKIVRENEARAAMSFLGYSAERLIFLDLPYYYRRGYIDIPAVTDNDIKALREALAQLSPQHIFFSEEVDPHGAHKIGKEILLKALPANNKINLWGYVGAYASWPTVTAETLAFFNFSKEVMDKKIQALKLHKSQLSPLFPGSDGRAFHHKVQDYNLQAAQKISQRGILLDNGESQYAEVFTCNKP
ncbi:MAG: 6-phosphogluconolactonase [Chlamydiota bacterium]